MSLVPLRLSLLASVLAFLPAALVPAFAPARAAQAHAAPAAPAAEPARDPLDALFEAASRGETLPLERALREPSLSPARRVLIEAELALSRGVPGAGEGAALRRLTESDDPVLGRAALRIVTDAAFGRGDYAEAARVGRLLAEALAAAGAAEEAEAAGRVWRLAAMLAGRGRARVEGEVRAATVAAGPDKVGLTRISFSVNGIVQEAVVDTGASLSVLSAATARRLAVTVLEGETAIGNGVQGTVPTRIGIAARIEIAGTVMTNVPFLIIDDANLTFPQVPGGYAIPAIVGLPELRALRRIRIEQAGRFTVLPPAEGGAPNLTASGNELFAGLSVDGRVVPLHLDTGANQTSLTALYAATEPGRVQALQTGQGNYSSAGGTRAIRFATWTNPPLALAGRSFTLPALAISLPGDGPPPRFNGVLGADVLRRFESYTLDFEAMRMSLGTPVQAAPAG